LIWRKKQTYNLIESLYSVNEYLFLLFFSIIYIHCQAQLIFHLFHQSIKLHFLYVLLVTFTFASVTPLYLLLRLKTALLQLRKRNENISIKQERRYKEKMEEKNQTQEAMLRFDRHLLGSYRLRVESLSAKLFLPKRRDTAVDSKDKTIPLKFIPLPVPRATYRAAGAIASLAPISTFLFTVCILRDSPS
jgi:hypothetical protein